MRPQHCLPIILLPVLGGCWANAAPEIPAGKGRFEFIHEGRMLPVWTYRPASAPGDPRVVFVCHGMQRNGSDYRDQWVRPAEDHGFVVIVPEFSNEAFPKTAYNQGNLIDTDGRTLPEEVWSVSVIEPLFDTVREALASHRKGYFIYGHSAGAQFVHRLLFMVSNLRVERAVMANAGWYTMPDWSIPYPHGLRDSPASAVNMRSRLAQPFLVLLGTEDTDPNHPSLSRTPGSMAQGPHRLARGETFFAAAREWADASGVAFGWKLSYAPGIAHDNAGMAAYAAAWLFENRVVAKP